MGSCRLLLEERCPRDRFIRRTMKSTAISKSVLSALIIITLWADLGACSQSGVMVVVSNDGEKSISNLQLAFVGGKENLQSLAGGMSHEFTINPSGESGIDLSFTHSDGVARSTKLDVYLGKNYEGKIEVHIAADGTVKLKDIASPRPRSFGLF